METLDILPSPPTPQEVWWVAVEDSHDPSGGWLVLADPGLDGARTIAATLAQAGIGFIAAASATDLEQALAGTVDLPTIAMRVSNNLLVITRHADPVAQVLAELRLLHPEDRLLLVEETSPAQALLRRMEQLVETSTFEGVRLDLRSPPRGQGAWGLALASA